MLSTPRENNDINSFLNFLALPMVELGTVLLFMPNSVYGSTFYDRLVSNNFHYLGFTCGVLLEISAQIHRR